MWCVHSRYERWTWIAISDLCGVPSSWSQVCCFYVRLQVLERNVSHLILFNINFFNYSFWVIKKNSYTKIARFLRNNTVFFFYLKDKHVHSHNKTFLIFLFYSYYSNSYYILILKNLRLLLFIKELSCCCVKVKKSCHCSVDILHIFSNFYFILF